MNLCEVWCGATAQGNPKQGGDRGGRGRALGVLTKQGTSEQTGHQERDIGRRAAPWRQEEGPRGRSSWGAWSTTSEDPARPEQGRWLSPFLGSDPHGNASLHSSCGADGQAGRKAPG